MLNFDKKLKINNLRTYKLLPKIKSKYFKTGDILIRKSFENKLAMNAKVVIKAQSAANFLSLRKNLGSKYNGHAAIVVATPEENEHVQIAEAVPNYGGGHDGIGGVCRTTLSEFIYDANTLESRFNKTYTRLYVIYRCSDKEVSQMAAEIAKICTSRGQERYGWYNKLNAVTSILKQRFRRGFYPFSSEPKKVEKFYNFIYSKINQTHQTSKKCQGRQLLAAPL